MSTAIRLMKEMEKGTRLYSSKTKDGLINYQLIVKHERGKVEQYSKFGETKANQPPETINISSPTTDCPIGDNSLVPLTQPNINTYELDAKEKGEEDIEKEEEEEETQRDMSESYTLFNKDKNELFYKNLHFKVDSNKEFFQAVERTRKDEKTVGSNMAGASIVMMLKSYF